MKKWLIASTVVLTSLSLSACGTSQNTSGGTAKPAADDKAAKQTSAASATAAPGKEVKLKFLTQVIDYPKNQDQINAALHKVYPNITVEFEHIADNYDAVLKTKLATGDAPDIFNYSGYFAMKPFVEANQVLDLSNDKLVELVLPNFRDAGKYNGKTYGIPAQVLGYGLIYNKDAFKDAGIANAPKTLTELKDDVEKLKKVGITPFASGFKDVWLSYHMFWAMQGSTLDNFKQFYDDMNAGKSSFKNDKLVKAFDLLDMYVTNSGGSPLSSDFSNMAHLVGTKKAAMAIQGVWAYSEAVKLDPKVQLGLAPIPVSDDSKEATLLADADGVMYIAKDSKHPDEAKSFIKWMLSKDGAEATVGAVLKQQSASAANPQIDLNSLSADAAAYIKSGNKTSGFIINYWPSGLADIIGKDMQDYISKVKTRDQFFADIDASWKKFAGK